MEVFEPQDHLFQRRIAGALPQAVDRGVDVGGTAAHRRQGVGGGQAEVIVGMHLQFQVAQGTQIPDALKDGEGVQHPQGVGEAQAPRPGLLRGLGHAPQELGLGPGPSSTLLLCPLAREAEQPCRTHTLSC